MPLRSNRIRGQKTLTFISAQSLLPRGRAGTAVRHTSIGHDCFSIAVRRAHGRGDQLRVSFERALFLVEKPVRLRRLSVAFAPSSLERCCGASARRVGNGCTCNQEHQKRRENCHGNSRRLETWVGEGGLGFSPFNFTDGPTRQLGNHCKLWATTPSVGIYCIFFRTKQLDYRCKLWDALGLAQYGMAVAAGLRCMRVPGKAKYLKINTPYKATAVF